MPCSTLPCSANLQLPEAPPPSPQNKQLPEIPTQARPRTAPDRVSQRVQDHRVPPGNPPYLRQKARANYSFFPKHSIIPPRTSSLAYASRSNQKTHKPQQSPCLNTIGTKQLHRHIAELYHGPSRGNEKTFELRDRSVQELLPRASVSPSAQESDIGLRGRNVIRPRNEVITGSEIEVAHSSPRSPPDSATISPQLEYYCNKENPIISQPFPPKALRPELSSGNSNKATSPLYPNSRAATDVDIKADYHYNRRPSMGSRETNSNHTTRGRRPIRASPELGIRINSLESRRREVLEARPKFTTYEGPVSSVLATSRSATHLPMCESESRPMLRSVLNLRRAAEYELHLHQLHQFHQLPQSRRSLISIQPPWVTTPLRSVFDSDDEENDSCFDFLRICRRKSNGSGRNNSLRFKWRRSKNISALSSPHK